MKISLEPTWTAVTPSFHVKCCRRPYSLTPPSPSGRSRTIMARMGCHLRISQSIETQLQRKHGTGGGAEVGRVNFGVVVICLVGRKYAVSHQVCCCFTQFKREEFGESRTIRHNPAGEARQPAPSDRRCKIHSAAMTTPTDVPASLCGAASGMLGAVLFAGVCFKIRLATIHVFAHT